MNKLIIIFVLLLTLTGGSLYLSSKNAVLNIPIGNRYAQINFDSGVNVFIPLKNDSMLYFHNFSLPTVIDSQPLLENKEVTPIPQPTPIPIPDETANWKAHTVNNLTFKIPPSWWSLKKEEPGLLNPEYLINPTELTYPSNRPLAPLLTLRLEYNTTVEKRKAQIYRDWNFVDVKEEKLIINGLSVLIIEGMTKPGEFDSILMKRAIVQSKEGIYDLFYANDTKEYRDYFDLILSTFKFIN